MLRASFQPMLQLQVGYQTGALFALMSITMHLMGMYKLGLWEEWDEIQALDRQLDYVVHSATLHNCIQVHPVGHPLALTKQRNIDCTG